MVKLQNLDDIDKPREKLQTKGPAALSDFELLQALIGSGNKHVDVSTIAKDTLKILSKHGADITYVQLEQINGMGGAKITELLAAIELARRYLVDTDRPIIDSPEKAAEQLADIRDKRQEHFVCITLDGANRLMAKRTVTIGTLNASLVHPREVFADAIADRAAAIIVAHNHPSGTLAASEADIEVTRRIQDSGKLLGISLMDHIIITKNSHLSIMPLLQVSKSR